MSPPVPKPRTRYMLRRSLQSDSCDSNVAQDEAETDSKNPDVTESADRPEDPPGGGDIVEKIAWPATPPESPSASDDEDIKSLSEWVKELATSDSSTDEFPVMPLTQNSHSALNNHPPAEHFSFTSTESPPQVQNAEHISPSKPPTEKKPCQRPKKPRTATIRVSRSKSSAGAGNTVQPEENSHSAVSRSSWLDVWKSRK